MDDVVACDADHEGLAPLERHDLGPGWPLPRLGELSEPPDLVDLIITQIQSYSSDARTATTRAAQAAT